MKHWWVLLNSSRTQKEKCSWLHFCEKCKIFTRLERQFSVSGFSLSKNFFTDSKNMFSLFLSVYIDWGVCMLIKVYCKTSWFSLFDKWFDFIGDHVFKTIFKRSNGAFYVGALWNHIKTFTCLKNWKSWYKGIFFFLFKLVKIVFDFLVEINSLPNCNF